MAPLRDPDVGMMLCYCSLSLLVIVGCRSLSLAVTVLSLLVIVGCRSLSLAVPLHVFAGTIDA